ncbi:MAG: NADPH-dependent FMN reductase [Pseudonocardia sp.]
MAIRTAIVIGSTRPGRRGAAVARWAEQVAARHSAVVDGRAVVEVVDVAEFGLPLLDEPVPAMFGDYRHRHTSRWAETISSFDAFVFVTPEYNHSLPAALKNAIDYLYAEWDGKPAGVIGYGIHGASRAIDHLRLVLAEVRAAVVPTQISLSIFTEFDFSGFDPTDPTAAGVFRPGADQETTLVAMLDEVVAWANALRPLRPDIADARSVPA